MPDSPGDVQERRIAAIVLPELMIELASASAPGETPARARKIPLGVVLCDPELASEQKAGATAALDAVNPIARRYGVHPGQTIAEACVVVSNLVVRELAPSAVGSALGRIAEVALGFGATVAFEAPDTVWVDITGAAHLFGSEAALATELSARVRALGHATRVAIASGPRLAQAFARWAPPGRAPESALVVPRERTRELVQELPLRALPLDAERFAWFVKLGLLTVGDLAKLPRAAVASRLGDDASRVLDLCQGKDPEPLSAFVPPSVPIEESSWDEPQAGIEPLLFVLRGLAARLSARLAGRGEAAQKLALAIRLDPGVARLEGVPAERTLVFDLASPLWREEEIRRVVGARLERTKLGAPTLGLKLEAPAVIRAIGRQLDLSRVSAGVTGQTGLESLPVLIAELAADVGKHNLGVLALVDAHRPEAQSALVPALGEASSPPRAPKKARRRPGDVRKALPDPVRLMPAPTRLLQKPVKLEAAIRSGATLRIDHRLLTIERVEFERRLDGVEWWRAPVSRDYLRLWLQGASGGFEAWVYVDRRTGERFLTGIAD